MPWGQQISNAVWRLNGHIGAGLRGVAAAVRGFAFGVRVADAQPQVAIPIEPPPAYNDLFPEPHSAALPRFHVVGGEDLISSSSSSESLDYATEWTRPVFVPTAGPTHYTYAQRMATARIAGPMDGDSSPEYPMSDRQVANCVATHKGVAPHWGFIPDLVLATPQAIEILNQYQYGTASSFFNERSTFEQHMNEFGRLQAIEQFCKQDRRLRVVDHLTQGAFLTQGLTWDPHDDQLRSVERLLAIFDKLERFYEIMSQSSPSMAITHRDALLLILQDKYQVYKQIHSTFEHLRDLALDGEHSQVERYLHHTNNS